MAKTLKKRRRKGGSIKKTKYPSRKSSIDFIEVSKTPTSEELVENPKIVKLKKGRKLKKSISFVLEESSSNSSTNKYSQPHIVTTFLQMLNTVKLYHWKTSSYAQHKATDELYAKLNESIDSFVEIMLGKKGNRVNLTGTKTIPLHDYDELSSFEKEVEMYKDYLIGMSSFFDSKLDSDLLNTRDELLGHLNQFTYLLTFK